MKKCECVFDRNGIKRGICLSCMEKQLFYKKPGFKRLSLQGKYMWLFWNTPLTLIWWETLWTEIRIKWSIWKNKYL
jgi:hypothetical protein